MIWIMNYKHCQLYSHREESDPPNFREVIIREGDIEHNSYEYDIEDPTSYSKALGAALEHINNLTPAEMKKTTPATADIAPEHSAPLMKFVQIREITPDPNQPRKHFDPAVDLELLNSIKEQGILQPILIRPVTSSKSAMKRPAAPDQKEAPYLVVCGERRFRAALAIIGADPGWMGGFVPAQIRIMNDDEALEAQIVENLQRKEVHPLEEAMAFKTLGEHGLTQEQIGSRVGKGDRFVRARLVLCNLTQAWQDLFYRNAIDLETALKICNFGADIQKQILADRELTKEQLQQKDLRIQVKDFNKYRGDLAAATFDLADPNLNAKMGPCHGCRFNTATAALFPDDTQSPRCLNLGCFSIKTEAGFNILLAAAKLDPDMVLVKTGYRDGDEPLTAQLKKEGHTILSYGDYHEEEPPEPFPTTFEEWKKIESFDMWDCYDKDMSEEENRREFKDIRKHYEREVKEHEEGMAKGKYKKALVVQGSGDSPRGSIIYISIYQRRGHSSGADKSQKTPAQKVAEGKATPSDYAQEIERLKKDIEDTEKRKVDNAHNELVKAYTKGPIVTSYLAPMTKVERVCLIYFLLDKIGGVEDLWSDDLMYEEDEQDEKLVFARSMGVDIKKAVKGKRTEIKVKDLGDPREVKDRPAIWKFLQNISDEQFGLIVRRVVSSAYDSLSITPNSYQSGEAWIIRQLIEDRKGTGDNLIDIKAIEKAHNDKAAKRIDRANERIKEMKGAKKELETKRNAKLGLANGSKPAGKKSIKKVKEDGDKKVAVVKEAGKILAEKLAPQTACRQCGCTQNNCRQCIEVSGQPCSWVEPALCSSCQELNEARIWLGIEPGRQDLAKQLGNSESDSWIKAQQNLRSWLSKIYPATKDVKAARKLVDKPGPVANEWNPINFPLFRVMLQEYRQHQKTNQALDIALNEPMNVFPFAEEAYAAAGIGSPADRSQLIKLVAQWPDNGYRTYFLEALGKEKVKHESKMVDSVAHILRSAEFLALLRITQESLTEAETKYIQKDYAGERTPLEALKLGPTAAIAVINRLIEFWKTQKAQQGRKDKKGKAQTERRGAPDQLTDHEKAAWDFWEIGKHLEDLSDIGRIVKQILETASDTKYTKNLRGRIDKSKGASVDEAPEKTGDLFVNHIYYGSIVKESGFLKAMVNAHEFMIQDEQVTEPTEEGEIELDTE
jgi:ParB/RepB/Spo0J family partition protein